VHNPSAGKAWNLTVLDRLPNTATSGMCDAAPTAIAAQIFQANGVTAVGAPLVGRYRLQCRIRGRPDLHADAEDAHSGGRAALRAIT
jgi:hypothetical protein